jgi:TatD DNase family protein
MGLFDTHCHLTYDALAADPHGAWHRAREAGVEAAIVVAIDAATAPAVLAFVEQYDELHAAVGIHPNHVAEAVPGDMEAIARLAEHPKVVAIGESGLDTYWDKAPLAMQREFLDAHIALALARDLPLVLHLRDTYPLAAEILAAPAAAGLRGVIHCFAGEGEEADPFIAWGWPISFSGILTYPRAENVRAAARRTPLAQCLVETDSPWLTPRGAGRRDNEPALVVHTARELAAIKEIAYDDLVARTTENARRVFRC